MKFVPHDYQQRAMDRIINEPNVGLWLDMGLGKTVTTLFALKELRFSRFQIGKTLIVAPKKVSEATWQNELKKWDGLEMFTVSTILGPERHRRASVEDDADIYVINRDNIPWLEDNYGKTWKFDCVVLDESSSFKNPKAQRFRSLKRVRSKISRIIELTGTPAARDYMDLWSQIYLLDAGKRLGRTLTSYRDSFFRPDKRNGSIIYSYKLRNGADAEITNALSDICFSMRASDYLELPGMIVHDVVVELDCKARKAYENLEKDYVLQLPDDTVVDAASAAVLRNKLLQVSSGVVYDEQHGKNFIHDCKLEAFRELVEQINAPVLVFYGFRNILPCIEYEMAKIKKKCVFYEGPKDADMWNKGQIDVLVAHPASCAYGLNLQFGGNHIVWYGLTDSLELYLQANARLHRQGQTKPVFVHRLYCSNTADMDVMSGLEAKDRRQEVLLEAMKERIERIKRGE